MDFGMAEQQQGKLFQVRKMISSRTFGKPESRFSFTLAYR